MVYKTDTPLKVVFSIFVLLMALSLDVYSQATVGGIDIDPKATLAGKSIGESGIRVDISDIIVTGYSHRLLTFALSVSDAEGKDVYTEHLNFETSKDEERWELIRFEITFGDLQRVFGKGNHDLYVVFVVHTIKNQEMHVLTGGYHALPVRLELQQGDLLRKGREDRSLSIAALADKAASSSIYADSLALMEKYDIGILITKFSSGSDPTREMYEWQYLTENDVFLMERYLEIIIESFNRLPLDFVGKTGLKSIALVKNLHYLGLDVGAGFDITDRMILIEVNDFSTIIIS